MVDGNKKHHGRTGDFILSKRSNLASESAGAALLKKSLILGARGASSLLRVHFHVLESLFSKEVLLRD